MRPAVLPVALALALVHLVSGRLRFLDVIPRSRWLSLAGGASVAYVFVHVLPELETRGPALAAFAPLGFVEHHVYLVALGGFAVFYGLERLAQRTETGTDSETATAVFWLHVGSFAVYNALIGYLLVHREQPGLASLVFFASAMGLHFVVNDWGLRHHHGRAYDHLGRWLLAGAILVGTVVGVATVIGEAAIAVLFGFLAGGVVLNVIKEELPAERESRFLPFAFGAILYSALLLVV